MVSVSIDVFGVLDQILKLVPETTNVAVVIGNSPIEKRWLEDMRKLFQPLTQRVAITYYKRTVARIGTPARGRSSAAHGYHLCANVGGRGRSRARRGQGDGTTSRRC